MADNDVEASEPPLLVAVDGSAGQAQGFDASPFPEGDSYYWPRW
jgi:hypothetical protein